MAVKADWAARRFKWTRRAFGLIVLLGAVGLAIPALSPQQAAAQTYVSKSCGGCGRSVPTWCSAGGTCPYCGCYWGTENTSYSYSRSYGSGNDYVGGNAQFHFHHPMEQAYAERVRAAAQAKAAADARRRASHQAFAKKVQDRLARRRETGTKETYAAMAKAAMPNPLSPSEMSVDEDGIVEIRWPMLLQRKFSEECTELSVAASEGDVDQIDFMLESLLDNLRASIRDCRPWEYIAAKKFLMSLKLELSGRPRNGYRLSVAAY